MNENKKIPESNNIRFSGECELARHMTDVYMQTVLSEEIRSGKIITPTDFAQKYLDCYQISFDMITRN